MSHSLALTSSDNSKRARVPAFQPGKAKQTEFPKRLPADVIKKVLEMLSLEDYGVSQTVCKSLKILHFDTWMRQNGTVQYSFVKRFFLAEKRPALADPSAASSPSALVKNTGKHLHKLDLACTTDLLSLSELFPENTPPLFPKLKHLSLRFDSQFRDHPEALQRLINQIIRHCPAATHLTLNTPFFHEFFISLIAKLKDLQSVTIETLMPQWLDFSKIGKCKEMHLLFKISEPQSLNMLKSIPQVRSLALGRMFPALEGQCWKAISELAELRELELGPFIPFTDNALLLNSLTKLEKLHLRTFDVDSSALPILPDIRELSKKSLRHLTLTAFSDVQLIPFSLRGSGIHSLAFKSCKGLADDSFKMITTCSKLTRLEFDLEELSSISDTALYFLSKSRSLQYIKITTGGCLIEPASHEGITQKGLAALGNNPALRVLDLSEFHYASDIDFDFLERTLLEKNPKMALLKNRGQETAVDDFLI